MPDPTEAIWVMPAELRDLVDAELESGERVLWSAQPRASRMALGCLPLVLFGIPWTAFAVFWTAAASGFVFGGGHGPARLFGLFGLPFVLIGLAMLSSPLWALRKARRTLYVITDRRAILFDGGRNTAIRSFGPEALADTRRRQRPDGSGDILFDRTVSSDRHGHTRERVQGFLGIPNVREVERLLRDVAAGPSPQPGARDKYMR